MNSFIYSHLYAFILTLIFITSSSYSQGPTPYLIEESAQVFHTNGTIKSPLIAEGRLDIQLPNTQDVLQFIRINISDEYIGNTNIQSPASFADVAASPQPADRTSMYFDTTDGYAIRYNITNHTLIPKISLNLSCRNSEGGIDIHSGPENTILFNLTITSDKSINNAELYFRIRENTYPPDSMVLGAPSATSSTTIQNMDTDADTYEDTVYWLGDLIANIPVCITFPGTTQAGTNYNQNDQFVELNEDGSVKSTYTTTSTFTGTTIISRFSRGPIRQGLRMFFRDDVHVSGTITNKAQGLTYKLIDWALYNVTNLTYPVASGIVPAPQELLPDQTYDTPWYTAPGASEKYFVPEFNWYVKWDPSEYIGIASSTLDLPILYQADGIAQKSISIVQTDPARILNIVDLARHLGHSSIYFNSSTITSNVSSGYTIQNVGVYYSNLSIGGSEYDITAHAAITTTGNTLNITINDISKAIGKQLALNEDIIVRYQATGPTSTSQYTFTSTNIYILNTTSGTPLRLSSSASQNLPGIGEPQLSGPGSAGGGFTQNFATIDKSSSQITVKEPQDTAEVTAVFKIIDTGGKGIGTIHSEIILPEGSSLDTELINISTYNPHNERWQTYTSDRLIIKKDPHITGNTIRYSVKIKSATWDIEEHELNLKNSELYSITYTAQLPFGSNNLTTRLFGFNYYIDEEIFKDIETYIRITQAADYISPLEIRDSEFQPQQIIVGTPPRWLKTTDVYNPNSISLTHKFTTALFPEVISCHIRSGGEELKHTLYSNKTINALWRDTIGPKEKKTYLIEAATPPILIIDEKYSIEKYESTELIFITNTTLKNPSSIDYENITLIYPVSENNTQNVTQGSIELDYGADGTGSIKIFIPPMKKKTTTSVLISYTKTPPLLITSVDKHTYSESETVNLTIMFIPHENMSYSFIQIEVLSSSKDPQTIYADIGKMTALKERTPHTMYREFTIPKAEAGEYTIRTTATLDPVGEITDISVFRLESSITKIKKFSFKIILLAAIITLIILARRIYRKKEFDQELSSLKKEVEKI